MEPSAPGGGLPGTEEFVIWTPGSESLPDSSSQWPSGHVRPADAGASSAADPYSEDVRNNLAREIRRQDEMIAGLLERCNQLQDRGSPGNGSPSGGKAGILSSNQQMTASNSALCFAEAVQEATMGGASVSADEALRMLANSITPWESASQGSATDTFDGTTSLASIDPDCDDELRTATSADHLRRSESDSSMTKSMTKALRSRLEDELAGLVAVREGEQRNKEAIEMYSRLQADFQTLKDLVQTALTRKRSPGKEAPLAPTPLTPRNRSGQRKPPAPGQPGTPRSAGTTPRVSAGRRPAAGSTTPQMSCRGTPATSSSGRLAAGRSSPGGVPSRAGPPGRSSATGTPNPRRPAAAAVAPGPSKSRPSPGSPRTSPATGRPAAAPRIGAGSPSGLARKPVAPGSPGRGASRGSPRGPARAPDARPAARTGSPPKEGPRVVRSPGSSPTAQNRLVRAPAGARQSSNSPPRRGDQGGTSSPKSPKSRGLAHERAPSPEFSAKARAAMAASMGQLHQGPGQLHQGSNDGSPTGRSFGSAASLHQPAQPVPLLKHLVARLPGQGEEEAQLQNSFSAASSNSGSALSLHRVARSIPTASPTGSAYRTPEKWRIQTVPAVPGRMQDYRVVRPLVPRGRGS